MKNIKLINIKHQKEKKKRYSKNKKCINCNKLITNKANRCYSCAQQVRFTTQFHPSLGRKRLDVSKRFKGIGNPNYKHGNTNKKKKCIDCEKEITYISKRCKSCSKNKTLNYQWLDGRSYLPYSPEFDKKLKQKIKIRDNYKCQCCGLTEKDHYKFINSGLHVHHIDYNKKHNNINNLITTCSSCNTKANFNRKYWKKYYYTIMKKRNEYL